MNTQALSRDEKQILDELEAHYSDRLRAVQAKRNSHGKPSKHETLTVDGVSIRIDPRKKEVVLSW